MYGKKQRIISFLMAFLLIFTFAFINPLTVSKSYGALPAIALTANGVKIIMGALASAGIGFTAGQALQEVDFDKAAESIANVVYRTLDGAEKLALMALTVVDNLVEVPISLYNSIVNNGKKVLQTPEYSASLLEQGITIKYANLTSDNSYDPDLHLPVYQLTNNLSSGWVTNREIDMREAEPFLVYDGTQSEINFFGQAECITTNYFDFATEDNPILEFDIISSSNRGFVSLTPSLNGYGLKYNNTVNNNCLYLINWSGIIYLYLGTANNGSVSQTRSLIDLPKDNLFNSVPFTSLKLFYYFVRKSDGLIGIHCDVYNGNEFVGQRQYSTSAEYGFNSVITNDTLFDTPSGLDTIISVEETPSPVITNTDLTANVLTLPTTVADTIGLTSADVNVGSTDLPDTPNTETIDRIDTNVGELVTGGELGEQVNINIGTVEGLHGELTEQVDFGAVFDTIAQYISSLDISSVTWFPTAVASFFSSFSSCNITRVNIIFHR